MLVGNGQATLDHVLDRSALKFFAVTQVLMVPPSRPKLRASEVFSREARRIQYSSPTYRPNHMLQAIAEPDQ